MMMRKGEKAKRNLEEELIIIIIIIRIALQ
jgi:hypothetical protein